MAKYLLLLLLILPNLLVSQERTSRYDQPVELGHVSWLRDYHEARLLSEYEGKPILILFQEVPGCATCRNYGKNVLTHPLMVEVIENEFVPLTIFNNKEGSDKETLNAFNEPTWNNPVVRIVDSNGKDLVSRLNGDYSTLGIYASMEEAIIRDQRKIPEYMKLLKSDLLLESGKTEEATYSMYCFWTGEKHFGEVDGVIATSPGFGKAKEVVQVIYDPIVISKKQLDKIAESGSCNKTSGGKFRMDQDPQYYLKQSKYNVLPLSKAQRTKVNSYIGNQKSPDALLSPKQLIWLQGYGDKKGNMLYDKDFLHAWKVLESQVR